MSRVNTDARLSQNEDVKTLKQRIYEIVREFGTQINAFSEGRIQGAYNAATAAPSAGLYAQGDFIRNATPTELGTAGAKYVVFGWVCVVAGDPATFVGCRFLTGN
jgi:hypothetical protein